MLKLLRTLLKGTMLNEAGTSAERTDVRRTYVDLIGKAKKSTALENIKKIASALKLPISKLLKNS